MSPQPDLTRLSNQQLIPLLAEDHYALIPKGNHNELWFGNGPIADPKFWKPLAAQAPATGEAPSARYSCQNLTQQKVFFRKTRKAIINAFLMAKVTSQTPSQIENENPTNAPPSVSLTASYGETLLALEKSFLVHKGLNHFDFKRANSRYLQILATAKTLAKDPDLDFFEAWTLVRKSVYTGSTGDIDYCRDKATMIDALAESCTNCVGETFLLYALFMDAGFKLPAGWQLGTQSFKDHLRLIAFNPTTKKTQDLATGIIEGFRAVIYGPEALPLALLLGHPALKFENELSWIRSQKPQPFYRSCYWPGFEIRPATRPSDFSFLSACDNFTDGKTPARASNKNKTNAPREVGPNESTANDGSSSSKDKSQENAGGASSLLSNFPSAWSLLVDGIASMGDILSDDGSRWWGNKQASYNLRDLYSLANNLIPSEGSLLRDSIDDKEPSSALIQAFSAGRLIEFLGYGYYREMDAQNTAIINRRSHRKQEPMWDSIVLPIYIVGPHNPFPDKEEEAITRFLCKSGSTKPSDCRAQFGICGSGNVICLSLQDESEYQRLKGMTSVERFRSLLMMLREDFAVNVQKISTSKDSDSSVRAHLKQLATAPIEKFAEMAGSDLDTFKNILDIVRPVNYNAPPKSETEKGQSQLSNPFILALLKTFNVKTLKALSEYIEQAKSSFRAETVSVIKAIDQMDVGEQAQLRRSLDGLGALGLKLEPLHAVDPVFSREILKAAPNEKNSGLLAELLQRVLWHPRYFFTVEPEQDEIIPGRPYDPWKIQDPRVQDLIALRKESRLPHVDLPPSVGPNPCQPGDEGYKVNSLGFYIQCEKDLGQKANRTQRSESNQQGLIRTEDPGDAIKDKLGHDMKDVPVGLRDATAGREAEGQFAREVPLTDEELRLEANTQVTTVSRAVRTDSSLTTDPRQEVHLQPRTWGLLVPEKIENDQDAVLLHHVYRKKLRPMYRFEKFISWTATTPKVYEFDRKYYKDGLLADILAYIRRGKSADWIANFLYPTLQLRKSFPTPAESGMDFYRVALQELSRPKPGYVVLTLARLNLSEFYIATAMRALVNSSDPLDLNTEEPAGQVLPLFVRGDDGRDYGTVVDILTPQKQNGSFLSHMTEKNLLSSQERPFIEVVRRFTQKTFAFGQEVDGPLVFVIDRNDRFSFLGDFAFGELNVQKIEAMVRSIKITGRIPVTPTPSPSTITVH